MIQITPSQHRPSGPFQWPLIEPRVPCHLKRVRVLNNSLDIVDTESGELFMARKRFAAEEIIHKLRDANAAPTDANST